MIFQFKQLQLVYVKNCNSDDVQHRIVKNNVGEHHHMIPGLVRRLVTAHVQRITIACDGCLNTHYNDVVCFVER